MPASRERSKPASKLAEMRLDRDLSQVELSKRADVTLRTLIRLEHKQVAQPKVTDYARLAWVLNCSLDELIEDEWLAPLQGPGLPPTQK